jgi:AcrR family transcriptional regulator
MAPPSERVFAKRQAVITAAGEVFRRYGFERTTMGDLAKAAGMSRPALYLVFPTKLEIFNAMIEHKSDATMAAIREDLDRHPTLKAKLMFACERVIVENFEFVGVYPDASDMFAKDIASVEAAFDRFRSFVDRLIDAPLRASGVEFPTADVTRTFVAAIRGFPDVATDTDDLRRMIEIQCSLLLAAMRQPP